MRGATMARGDGGEWAGPSGSGAGGENNLSVVADAMHELTCTEELPAGGEGSPLPTPAATDEVRARGAPDPRRHRESHLTGDPCARATGGEGEARRTLPTAALREHVDQAHAWRAPPVGFRPTIEGATLKAQIGFGGDACMQGRNSQSERRLC